MATESNLSTRTLTAGADLSTFQYYAVYLSAARTVSRQTTANGAVYGILQNKPTSGAAAAVARSGWTKAVAGGTIAAGNALAVNSSGQLVAATGTNAAVVGIAITAAAAGDVFTVELWPQLAAGGLSALTNLVQGSILTFHQDLASITGNVSVVTAVTPGFAGTLKAFVARVSTPATTAAKATTLTPQVSGTPVTGGALALTSANATPLGAVIAASAITSANTFGATDTISIVSTSTTAFAEGAVDLLLMLG